MRWMKKKKSQAQAVLLSSVGKVGRDGSDGDKDEGGGDNKDWDKGKSGWKTGTGSVCVCVCGAGGGGETQTQCAFFWRTHPHRPGELQRDRVLQLMNFIFVHVLLVLLSLRFLYMFRLLCPLPVLGSRFCCAHGGLGCGLCGPVCGNT